MGPQSEKRERQPCEAAASAGGGAHGTIAAMEIVVYGASDDLIELDGGITEEFIYRDDDGDLVAFSDGTVLCIVYSSAGVWRITPVVHGSAEVEIVQAPEEDDTNYSDRAHVRGEVVWAVHGVSIVRA
jgi:hypothetical protein